MHNNHTEAVIMIPYNKKKKTIPHPAQCFSTSSVQTEGHVRLAQVAQIWCFRCFMTAWTAQVTWNLSFTWGPTSDTGVIFYSLGLNSQIRIPTSHCSDSASTLLHTEDRAPAPQKAIIKNVSSLLSSAHGFTVCLQILHNFYCVFSTVQ